MSIIALLVAGFLSSFEAGGSCIDALQQLRAVERLQVVSTDVLEDNVLAFTMSDSPRIGEKTAILICERDIQDALDEDDLAGDDFAPEVIAPSGATGDATGAATDETDALEEALVE